MRNDYNHKLKSQFNNAKLISQKIYYQNLYSKISDCFKQSDKILEIGAGAGISQIFLSTWSIDRTDFLSWDDEVSVKGGINAENLPFENDSYDIVFGVDILHHLNSPVVALNEVSRVLRKGGLAVFIEPYVSPFSYGVYKLFHDEQTSYRYNLQQTFETFDPREGDQGLAKALFCNKSGKKLISEEVTAVSNIEIDYMHPFSFFATGGLTKPINTGNMLIKVLLKIESYMPLFLLKVLGSRIRIVIKFKQ